MNRKTIFLLLVLALPHAAIAQDMALSFDQDDFVVTNVFSDVDEFTFDIQFAVPLAAGSYINPDITNLRYTVTGVLEPGTPSGFPAFALEREMSGDEFYAQGSSIQFQISSNAVLSDGVQAAELVGNGIVFTFNGKEIGNGRFHPTLFELNADGTGMMQNSDNIISENPFQQVDFGSEYINTLSFDPGNTTILTGQAPRKRGGGALSLMALLGLLLLARIRR